MPEQDPGDALSDRWVFSPGRDGSREWPVGWRSPWSAPEELRALSCRERVLRACLDSGFLDSGSWWVQNSEAWRLEPGPDRRVCRARRACEVCPAFLRLQEGRGVWIREGPGGRIRVWPVFQAGQAQMAPEQEARQAQAWARVARRAARQALRVVSLAVLRVARAQEARREEPREVPEEYLGPGRGCSGSGAFLHLEPERRVASRRIAPSPGRGWQGWRRRGGWTVS